MSGETIELLKGYDPKKMQFPAYMSQKLDGVPVRMIRGTTIPAGGPGHVEPFTRQGELIRSVDHLLGWASQLLVLPGSSFVGELYVYGMPFKQISGLVRQHAHAPELQLYVFDADLYPDQSQPYELRMAHFRMALAELQMGYADDLPIKIIPYLTVENDAAVQHNFEFLMKVNPGAEGVVLHSKAKTFQPGKRCWGTQRLKPEPTLDLQVVGYEEATANETEDGPPKGTPLGMVGRINVRYDRVTGAEPGCAGVVKSSVIGVGPGKLTHAERTAIWQDYCKPYPRSGPGIRVLPIVEVKYMTDDTYDALRQPTVVRIRADKSVSDVHHV